MVKTSFDQSPDDEVSLGTFRRWPVVFTVVHLDVPAGTPNTYRVDCDDGVGPHEVCRFGDDPEAPPVWRGAWNGDEWCSWILAQARVLVANPSRFEF